MNMNVNQQGLQGNQRNVISNMRMTFVYSNNKFDIQYYCYNQIYDTKVISECMTESVIEVTYRGITFLKTSISLSLSLSFFITLSLSLSLSFPSFPLFLTTSLYLSLSFPLYSRFLFFSLFQSI